MSPSLGDHILKQPADRISGLRCQQEMDMVGHQYVGMDSTVTGLCNALQDLQVFEIILRLEKHRFRGMASLHEMGGNVRNVGS
jgi:hypothetical protein